MFLRCVPNASGDGIADILTSPAGSCRITAPNVPSNGGKVCTVADAGVCWSISAYSVSVSDKYFPSLIALSLGDANVFDSSASSIMKANMKIRKTVLEHADSGIDQG